MTPVDQEALLVRSQETRCLAAASLPASATTELFGLVLSDPSSDVRLEGSKAFGRRLLNLAPANAFTELTDVVRDFANPWTTSKDPRLPDSAHYDATRSPLNVALGALRTLQILWQSAPVGSDYHIGLATAFQNAGFIEIMKACVVKGDELVGFITKDFKFENLQGNGWFPTGLVQSIRRSTAIFQIYSLYFQNGNTLAYWGKDVFDKVDKSLSQKDQGRAEKLFRQARTASGVVSTAILTLQRMTEAKIPCSQLSEVTNNSIYRTLGKPELKTSKVKLYSSSGQSHAALTNL